MRFKQFSGTAIVPFLARVVLALAFATVGYNKIFTEWQVTDQATLQSLRDAGVNLSPPAVDPADAEDLPESPAGAGGAGGADGAEGTSLGLPRTGAGLGTVQLAGFVQPAGGDSALPAEPEPPTADTLPAPPLPESADVRSLHRITLMLYTAANPADGDSARVPGFVGDYAKWLAWVAALTEFLGGVMILFGMLTRVWGLGLSIAMVTAFWLTTVPVFAGIESTGVISQALAFAEQIGDYNRAVAQLALFVLALGLVLTGAGPLSVDAILFARDPHKDVARDRDTYEAPMHPGVPPGGAAMTPGSVAAPMGAAAGTAYPPNQPTYQQGPPGVQMPPSGGYQAPPPTDAWGTPVAPVPPPAAPEIPLHHQSTPVDPSPPLPPVAPRPQSAEGLPAVPAPEDEPRTDADAAGEDASSSEEERPRYQPGQSFGGEGRPL